LPDLCRGMSNKQTQYHIFLFGCCLWSLWLIRNDFVFIDFVVCSPNTGIYRTISFMQKWRILNKEKARWIDMVTRKLQAQLSFLRYEDDWRKGPGRKMTSPTATEVLPAGGLTSFLSFCVYS
jgi:hypothetical protein